MVEIKSLSKQALQHVSPAPNGRTSAWPGGGRGREVEKEKRNGKRRKSRGGVETVLKRRKGPQKIPGAFISSIMSGKDEGKEYQRSLVLSHEL